MSSNRDIPSRLEKPPLGNCCKQSRMGLSRIYFLADAAGSIRYVGQTSHSIRCRLSQHISKARTTGRATPVVSWVRGMLQKGETPVIKFVEEVRLQDADAVEMFWIRRMREVGHPLLNFSDGGNMCGMLGKHHSIESRRKMAAKATGRTLSKEAIAKIVSHHKGRKHSPEEKERRASKLRGLKRSKEFCEQASKRMKEMAFRKPVRQLSKLGELIAEFPSVTEAAMATGAAKPNIIRAAKNPKFTSKGFFWAYGD